MTFVRFVFLFCLVPLPGLAGNWTGALVDAKCYASAQRNTNPHETHPGSTSRYETVRQCSPKTKTKSFALIQADGSALTLNQAGNQKATELLLKAGKKPRYSVDVTGEQSGNALIVDSIAVAK